MRPFRFVLFLCVLTGLLAAAGYLWTPLVLTSDQKIPAPTAVLEVPRAFAAAAPITITVPAYAPIVHVPARVAGRFSPPKRQSHPAKAFATSNHATRRHVHAVSPKPPSQPATSAIHQVWYPTQIFRPPTEPAAPAPAVTSPTKPPTPQTANRKPGKHDGHQSCDAGQKSPAAVVPATVTTPAVPACVPGQVKGKSKDPGSGC